MREPQVLTPKPVYDPEKNYKWDEDQPFTFAGLQFASIYHMMMREMNLSGGAEMAVKLEVYSAMMSKFIEGIETGVIYEVTEEIPDKASSDSLVKDLFAK